MLPTVDIYKSLTLNPRPPSPEPLTLKPAHPKLQVHPYTAKLRAVIHKLFREGRGTRDLCGAGGLTTEQFIDAVADELK